MKTTRLELFDQVWSAPMTKLAKNYGCSDVGLRKVCIKYDIPLPPAGHWQKILFGKGYPKPELLRPDYNPEIEINPAIVQVPKVTHQKDAASKESLEKAPAQNLQPLTELSNLHPLIKTIYERAIRYQKAIERDRKNGRGYSARDNDLPYEDKGRFHYRPADGCIPICASFDTLFRALKILDPIIKALAQNGYKFSFEDPDRYRPKEFVMAKDGEKIYINIREGYSKTHLSTKSKTLLEKLSVYQHSYSNQANGIIYFEIKHEFKYSPEIFKDQKRVTLDQQMDSILQYLLAAPNEIKTERKIRHLKHLEYERQQAVQTHNQNIAKSQHLQLEKALEESRLIKELSDLENYLVNIEGAINELTDKEIVYAKHWLNIVRYFAQEKHPLKKRVDLFKKVAADPQDDYNHYWAREEKVYVKNPQDGDNESDNNA